MALTFRDSRKRALVLSYLKDWVLIIVLLVGFFAIDLIEPFHTKFSVSDKALMYPYALEDRVSTPLVFVVSFVIPTVIIAFIALALRKSPFDLHNGVIGLLLSLTLTIMVTEVVKISVGRPRPDFLARCQPHPGAADPPLGLSDHSICMQTNGAMMTDGYKGFPSGHSSISFAGLTYLSLYLGGKMHVFDHRGHAYKGFIFSLPLVGATLISITRLQDYRHRWGDVVVGGVIGILFAVFSYYQYYPNLHHPQSHKPFSPRVPRTPEIGRTGTVSQALTADLDLNGDAHSREGSSDLETVRVEQPGVGKNVATRQGVEEESEPLE